MAAKARPICSGQYIVSNRVDAPAQGRDRSGFQIFQIDLVLRPCDGCVTAGMGA